MLSALSDSLNKPVFIIWKVHSALNEMQIFKADTFVVSFYAYMH